MGSRVDSPGKTAGAAEARLASSRMVRSLMVELPQGLSSLGAAAWSCKEGGWQGLYLFWGVYVGIEETASGLDLRPRQVLLLTPALHSKCL